MFVKFNLVMLRVTCSPLLKFFYFKTFYEVQNMKLQHIITTYIISTYFHEITDLINNLK